MSFTDTLVDLTLPCAARSTPGPGAAIAFTQISIVDHLAFFGADSLHHNEKSPKNVSGAPDPDRLHAVNPVPPHRPAASGPPPRIRRHNVDLVHETTVKRSPHHAAPRTNPRDSKPRAARTV